MRFSILSTCLAGWLCAAMTGLAPADEELEQGEAGVEEASAEFADETLEASWNESLAAEAADKPAGDKAASDPCKKKAKKKKPAGNPAQLAYKGLFYDNDFKYLDDPDDKTPCYFGDAFKQRAIGCWMFDLGGEYRARHHNEVNLRGSTLNGNSDDYLLQRTRLYTNARYKDWFRFYGEAIDAVSDFESNPPRTIEENRFDALNLFVDLRLHHADDGNLWFRGGRQELLYGDQRLVSPLDWANTRRTFDGVKGFWRGKDWDVDGFWTRPVPFAQHAGHDSEFDAPSQTQEFMGVYSTYKGKKDHIREFYFLRYSDDDAVLPFDANLFGTRWKGKRCDWLYEVEGGYQFGGFGALTQSAGFLTTGLGRGWDKHPWKPVLWCYYDWASGDRDPTDGQRGTFNQLFPLVHKYFGFTDLVARQNIRDLNFQLIVKPSDTSNFLVWYHLLHLDQARDSLYNAPGVPIRTDATGAAGRYVGQNLDLQWQKFFTPRFDATIGYTHFFAGSFVQATNPAGVSGNAGLYYGQYTWRF